MEAKDSVRQNGKQAPGPTRIHSPWLLLCSLPPFSEDQIHLLVGCHSPFPSLLPALLCLAAYNLPYCSSSTRAPSVPTGRNNLAFLGAVLSISGVQGQRGSLVVCYTQCQSDSLYKFFISKNTIRVHLDNITLLRKRWDKATLSLCTHIPAPPPLEIEQAPKTLSCSVGIIENTDRNKTFSNLAFSFFPPTSDILLVNALFCRCCQCRFWSSWNNKLFVSWTCFLTWITLLRDLHQTAAAQSRAEVWLLLLMSLW